MGLLLPMQPTRATHAKNLKLVLSFSEMLRWLSVILLCDIYCFKVEHLKVGVTSIPCKIARCSDPAEMIVSLA